jgi:hypothetical protein
VTDLRDQLADFDAAARRPRPIPTCHPRRQHKARGLCIGCYEHHLLAGTLDAYPTRVKTRGQVIPRYLELRAAGHTTGSIACQIGISIAALYKHLDRATAAGALTPDRRTA